MVATLPLPPPTVKLMDEVGKPTQPGREFLERLEQMVRALNAVTPAPLAASYVLIANDATLTGDRQLAAGTNITITDNGANSTVSIAAAPPVGSVLQVLQDTYTTHETLSAAMVSDDTTPLDSEGTEILSQAITPASSSNKVLVETTIYGTLGTVTNSLIVALFRGSTCINAHAQTFTTVGAQATIKVMILDSPASASAQTYTVRVGPTAGSAFLNGSNAERRFGGTSACTLTVSEIKA